MTTFLDGRDYARLYLHVAANIYAKICGHTRWRGSARKQATAAPPCLQREGERERGSALHPHTMIPELVHVGAAIPRLRSIPVLVIVLGAVGSHAWLPIPQAFLKASNSGSSHEFGRVVSVSGDTMAVSAPGEASCSGVVVNGASGYATDTGCTAAGAVYVYKRDGGTWAAEAYLKAPTAASSSTFGGGGVAVSASGDTIAVGAMGESSCSTSIVNGASGYATDAGCSAAGAVYIFVRTGSDWTAQAFIKAPNAKAGDEFGYSVSLDGDALTIGAQGESSCSTSIVNGASGYPTDTDCSFAGAVYIFVRSSSTWTAQAFVKAPNARADDRFGLTVSMSSNTIAVGAECAQMRANTNCPAAPPMSHAVAEP